MFLDVTKIFVRSFDMDRLDIFWQIAPVRGTSNDATSHQIFDFDFFVLRSEAAMGPFTQIGGPLRDTYMFRDTNVSLLHKWRQYYYQIKVIHRPTGDTKIFGPVSQLEPEQDLIAAEIIRQEDLLFREFIGRKCWLFPARTFGPVCTCFDITLGRRTRSSHALCFDTGWLGGYLAPIEIFLQVDPYPKQSQRSALDETQQNDTIARLIAFPPVSPKDVIVESENRRWRVMVVNSTQRLRSVMRQELSIHEIPKGDIEYLLPINVDTKTLTVASERNFTNPYHVDEDGDYSDIFATFGHPRGAIR